MVSISGPRALSLPHSPFNENAFALWHRHHFKLTSFVILRALVASSAMSGEGQTASRPFFSSGFRLGGKNEKCRDIKSSCSGIVICKISERRTLWPKD